MTGWREPAGRPTGLRESCLIVPTYQRPKDVLELLERLESLPDPPGEVVIVDGSHDDRTALALGERRGRVLPFDLAYVRSRPGLTRQRNVGIDASSREFVFYLDDDCRPEPGYFSALQKVFEEDRERAIGAVCGSFVNVPRGRMSLRRRLRFLLGLIPRDAMPGHHYPAGSPPREMIPPFEGLRSTELVPGGATAYRREVFTADRFSLFFDGYAQGEDTEMSLRIGRRWKLAWCGHAHVGHYHAAGGRPDAFRKGRMDVRNRYFIWKRHRADAAPWKDRIRFWLDIPFVLGCDLAYMVTQPPRVAHLRHALGVAGGAIESLVAPPRYEEPPPRREYEIDWR